MSVNMESAQSVQQSLALDAFVDAHGTHNAIQRANAERIVIWNGKSLVRRRVDLKMMWLPS